MLKLFSQFTWTLNEDLYLISALQNLSLLNTLWWHGIISMTHIEEVGEVSQPEPRV